MNWCCWSNSTKFARRSSLILCPLQRVATIITDDGISDADRKMVEDAGVQLIIAKVNQEKSRNSVSVA